MRNLYQATFAQNPTARLPPGTYFLLQLTCRPWRPLGPSPGPGPRMVLLGDPYPHPHYRTRTLTRGNCTIVEHIHDQAARDYSEYAGLGWRDRWRKWKHDQYMWDRCRPLELLVSAFEDELMARPMGMMEGMRVLAPA